MGCCSSKGQNSESQTYLDISNDILISFKYKNEKLFYGYPFYKELTQRLAYILTKSKEKWIVFEEQIRLNLRLMQQYQLFLQQQNDNPILNSDFNLSIRECFILELQEFLLMERISLDMSYPHRIQMKLFTQKTDIRETMDELRLIDQLTSIDSVHIFNGILSENGEQIMIQAYAEDQKLGNPITFNLKEFNNQLINEKVILIKDERRVLAKLTARFQLIYDIPKFIKYWIEELQQREFQMKVILSKMEEIKAVSRGSQTSEKEAILLVSNSSILNDSRRFDSLLSYDDRSLRRESRVSVYDLPYKIR